MRHQVFNDKYWRKSIFISLYLYLIIKDVNSSSNRYFVQTLFFLVNIFHGSSKLRKVLTVVLIILSSTIITVTKVAFGIISCFSYLFLSFFLDTAFIPYGTRLYIAYIRQNLNYHLLSSAKSRYSQQMKRSIKFVKTHTHIYLYIQWWCYHRRIWSYQVNVMHIGWEQRE